jgi:hypothetical protein
VGISLLDNKGVLIAPRLIMEGQVRPLCKAAAIALIDDSAERQPGPSFVIDLKGRMVASFQFGYVAEVGVDALDRFFWVQSQDFSEGRYVTRLWITEASGKPLLNKTFDAATTEQFSYKGESIPIKIRKPTPPG